MQNDTWEFLHATTTTCYTDNSLSNWYQMTYLQKAFWAFRSSWYQSGRPALPSIFLCVSKSLMNLYISRTLAILSPTDLAVRLCKRSGGEVEVHYVKYPGRLGTGGLKSG